MKVSMSFKLRLVQMHIEIILNHLVCLEGSSALRVTFLLEAAYRVSKRYEGDPLSFEGR
jgi:hypothetical protein